MDANENMLFVVIIPMLKKIGRLLRNEEPVRNEETFDALSLARAVVFLEMVFADFSGETAEEELVFRALEQGLEISAEETRRIVALAHEEREKSLDLHQFTRRINKGCSPQEKRALLETLWRLVYADGRVDKYEEALLRRLTALFHLSHREMIDAKLKVREELGLRHRKAPVRSVP